MKASWSRNSGILMPWTGMFELGRAISRIRGDKPSHQLSSCFTKDRPVVVERVPVDAQFFSRYFRPELPYTRVADVLFLSIAYVDRSPLITQDRGLRKAAVEAGVAVFSIEEFLENVGGPARDETETSGIAMSKVAIIPISCSCGQRFDVECEAHPGQTRLGRHEVRCPSCSTSHQVPDKPVRVATKGE